jgi:hypothetical protein
MTQVIDSEDTPMTNIKQYDDKYFKSFDKEECIDENIKRRINFVLSKYKCFNASHSEKIHMVHKKKLRNEGINKPLNMLLNKLSKDNYKKLKNEILQLCGYVGVTDIVKCVLTYSVMQIEYSDIYLDLLLYVGRAYSELEQELNDFMDHFMNNKWYILQEGCGYDDFCKKNHTKNGILNKIYTVVNLLEKNKIFKLTHNLDTLSDYCIELYKTIDTIEFDNIQDKINTYELYLDFLTCMIKHNHIYFIEKNTLIRETIYNDIVHKTATNQLQKKIEFKAMDMIEVLGS